MTSAAIEDEMFEVPEQYLKGLEKLATLEDKVIKGLLQSIEALPPDFDLQKVASFAASKYGIDVDDASAILNFIAALYFHIRNEDISSSIIIDAICENLKKGLPIKAAPKYISKFKSRLSNFLSVPNFFEIIYQAADLLPENENILANARLLTDIRPIFKSGISGGMSASLISHTLRLQYENINGVQEIFISLSSNSIEQLIEELQESLTKELSLQETFEKINIPCLTR